MISQRNTTLLKSSVKEKMVTLPLKELKKIKKENLELRSVIKAISSGELALQKQNTKSFKEFLKNNKVFYYK